MTLFGSIIGRCCKDIRSKFQLNFHYIDIYREKAYRPLITMFMTEYMYFDTRDIIDYTGYDVPFLENELWSFERKIKKNKEDEYCVKCQEIISQWDSEYEKDVETIFWK